MCWDGARWREDDTLAVFDRCRTTCRRASAECGDTKERPATKIAAAQTVAAIERLARADRRHATTANQWDTDPWLLNTPTGTVDLRTGEIHENRPAEYITKITAAGPGGDCPLWLRFLDRVTGGDSDVQLFLQRMVGYALTGCTREHALFFLYGTGANGKSVFLSLSPDYLATMRRLHRHHHSPPVRQSNIPPTWRACAALDL
jgi:putative DNA primase/helicase